MPIYEFYCPNCHTLYSFLSRSVNPQKLPLCPKNDQHKLQRQLSRFAVISGGKRETEGEADELPIDETKMERAMETLASQAEGLDEEDPRAAAQLMRKLSDMTGIEYGEGMQEALRRLEAGEDPDAIEAEMGELLEGEEEPFLLPAGKKGVTRQKQLPPKRDEELYEM